jgi:hypothetical protein
MSGGHFDHKDFHINDIADELESILHKHKMKKAGTPVTHFDSYSSGDIEVYVPELSNESVKLFEDVAKQLKRLSNIVHHIDYYISGDIAEETMHKRCKDEQ